MRHARPGWRSSSAISNFSCCRPQLLCKRASSMVLYAHVITEQPANEADKSVHSGPDSQTLAELAIRDTTRILQLRSTL